MISLSKNPARRDNSQEISGIIREIGSKTNKKIWKRGQKYRSRKNLLRIHIFLTFSHCLYMDLKNSECSQGKKALSMNF